MSPKQAGPPSNLRAVEARTSNLAQRTGTPVQRLRHRVAVVALIDMLNAMPGSPTPVIKGGTALMVRFGLRHARFSKDLDVAIDGDLAQFQEALTGRGRQPHHGFTFRVVRPQIIPARATAQQPRRMQVKLEYQAKPFATVQLEIACAEADALRIIDAEIVEDLIELGFEHQVRIALLSPPYQIAQKLHACTEVLPDGKANPRAHDLVDLALLAPLVEDRLSDVREACVDIFATRAQQTWPPTMVPAPDWDRLYWRARQESGHPHVPGTLDDALTWATAFVAAVDASR